MLLFFQGLNQKEKGNILFVNHSLTVCVDACVYCFIVIYYGFQVFHCIICLASPNDEPI